MSGTTFLCLLGIIIAIAPVFMVAAVMVDRWSLERTEELIADAVFEHRCSLLIASEAWDFWFVPIENDLKRLGLSHKFVFTTNNREDLLK